MQWIYELFDRELSRGLEMASEIGIYGKLPGSTHPPVIPTYSGIQ
jgi:hypothetical protein